VRPSPFVLLAGALLLSAACAPGPRAGGSKSDDLVGGRLVGDDEFPATFDILGSCTASKVGPRHILTAAHCVFMTAGPQKLYAGRTIHVSRQRVIPKDRDAALAQARPVVIERVLVPPAWHGALADGADVAVLVLTAASASALASIPNVTIDPTPVNPGDPLIMMGYGCEQYEEVPEDSRTWRARLKLQNVLATQARTPWPASYFPTPNVQSDPTAPGGCPGDSGGPVYRDDGTQRTVVGVNSHHDTETNGHTRVDTSAAHDVGRWLADAVAGREVESGQPACPAATAPISASDAEYVAEWKPPVVTRDACTDADLETLKKAADEGIAWYELLETTSSGVSEACRQCVVSPRTAPNWQLIVDGGSGWNVQACYATIEGAACGRSVLAYETCELSSCMECRTADWSPPGEARYAECTSKVTTGACAASHLERAQNCPALETTSARCANDLDAVRALCGR
jgi:hypothetical protein